MNTQKPLPQPEPMPIPGEDECALCMEGVELVRNMHKLSGSKLGTIWRPCDRDRLVKKHQAPKPVGLPACPLCDRNDKVVSNGLVFAGGAEYHCFRCEQLWNEP